MYGIEAYKAVIKTLVMQICGSLILVEATLATELDYNRHPCTNITYTGSTGVIQSANFPYDYPDNQHCVSSITVTGAYTIEAVFERLHTESFADLNFKGDLCNLDYVELRCSDQAHRLCGNWKAREHLLYFKFYTNSLDVKFISNAKNSRSGFSLRWYATPGDGSVVSPCSGSYIALENSCYEINFEPVMWEEGHRMCQEKGGVLASIQSPAEQSAIESELKRRSLKGESVWIGASDQWYEGDYMWTDRSAVTFKNWFPGWPSDNASTSQPSDDGLSNEDCVELRREFAYPEKGTGLADSYYWNDRDCSVKNPYICQHMRKNVKRSIASDTPLDCDNQYSLSEDKPQVVIVSPRFAEFYPRLVNCHAIVRAPFGKQLFVEFTHFDVEDGKTCEFDNVTLESVPLDDKPTTHCGNWNARQKHLRWTSSTNAMVLSFRSDNSKQFTGFQARIRIVDLGYRCPGANETGWMYGPAGCWAYTNIPTSHTEAASVCTSMNASVPATMTSREIGFIWNLVGHQRAEAVDGEECSTLWTAGNTDNSSSHIDNSGTDGGQANTKTSYHTAVADFQQNNGTACSPGFPEQNYTNNARLVYNFEAPVGYRIVFSITSLDIEYQDNCLYDSLKTQGMTKNRFFCGNIQTKPVLVSINNTATLFFDTDEDVTGLGFHITWYWISVNAVFNVEETSEMSGTISSLNFPNAFPDFINGCVTISAPENYRVLVETSYISLPGTSCDDAVIRCIAGDSTSVSLCGGTTLETMAFHGGVFVSERNRMDICIDVGGLPTGTGYSAVYSYVPATRGSVSDVLRLAPNQTVSITSVMDTAGFPDAFLQEINILTEVGYQMSLRINTTVTYGPGCELDELQISDTSLEEQNDDALMSCNCYKNTVPIQTTLVHSWLNAMNIRLLSGNHSEDVTSLRFHAVAISVKDPTYLNKTAVTTGSLVECLNTTCLNGGACLAADGRYICECNPHFTGLFCQTPKCQLKPCNHGNCVYTTTGYTCSCLDAYWGAACEYDTLMCRYIYCSGNGDCQRAQEDSANVTCQCRTGWKGERCHTAVPPPTEKLTIGQKLLKEPIWIGMIVTFTLILLFSVSYVVRRKCGHSLAKLLPSWMAPNNATIQGRGNKEDALSRRGGKYAFQLDMPGNSDVVDVSTPTEIYTHSEELSTIHMTAERLASIPMTAIDNTQHKGPTFQFFKAYSAETIHSSEMPLADNDRRFLSANPANMLKSGLLGGSFLMCENETEGKSNGLSRSHTISSPTELKGPPFQKINQTPYRQRSSTLDNANNSSHTINKGVTEPQTHCYPKIQILNDDNETVDTKSDSDNLLIAATSKQCDLNISIKSLNTTYTEPVDSGYPSTTISSQHTNVTTATKQSNTDASERRRKFYSKPKESSFYDLNNSTMSVRDTKLQAEVVEQNVGQPRYSHVKHRIYSFDSDACSHYQPKHEWFQMEAFSPDSDLRKNHSRSRNKDQSCRYQNHRMPVPYRGNHMIKYPKQKRLPPRSANSIDLYRHKNWRESTEILQHTHTHDCCRKKCHKYYVCSTDSDVYDSKAGDDKRRRNHHSKYKPTTSSWENTSVDKYKTQMMNAFLSDTTRTDYRKSPRIKSRKYENSTFNHSPVNWSEPNNVHTNNISYQANDSSLESSIHNSPMSEYNNKILCHIDQNESTVEHNTDSDESVTAFSVHVPDTTVGRRQMNTSNVSKDSAYQTKQSSVDQHPQRDSDKVRRRLEQAATHLAFMKHRHPNNLSLDSAIHTQSEEIQSNDEAEPRSNSSSVKRTPGLLLALQMKDMRLSEVKEELSGLSRVTEGNTTPVADASGVYINKHLDGIQTPITEQVPGACDAKLSKNWDDIPVERLDDIKHKHLDDIQSPITEQVSGACEAKLSKNLDDIPVERLDDIKHKYLDDSQHKHLDDIQHKYLDDSQHKHLDDIQHKHLDDTQSQITEEASDVCDTSVNIKLNDMHPQITEPAMVVSDINKSKHLDDIQYKHLDDVQPQFIDPVTVIKDTNGHKHLDAIQHKHLDDIQPVTDVCAIHRNKHSDDIQHKHLDDIELHNMEPAVDGIHSNIHLEDIERQDHAQITRVERKLSTSSIQESAQHDKMINYQTTHYLVADHSKHVPNVMYTDIAESTPRTDTQNVVKTHILQNKHSCCIQMPELTDNGIYTSSTETCVEETPV